MTKFAIRSIAPHVRVLPQEDQNRYYSHDWMQAGAPLVDPKSPNLLTFRSRRAAEQFVKDVGTSGFNNIYVIQL